MFYRSYQLAGFATACLVLMLQCEAQEERVEITGCSMTGNMSIGSVGSIRLNKTGNQNLDEGMHKSCNQLRAKFNVRAIAVLLNESGGPNAFASPHVFPDVIQAGGADPDTYPDGTVFLGVKLLQSELRSGRKYAILAILAHEYAHLMQNNRDFPFDGMWKELHADYMGGWYLGSLRLAHPEVVYQAFESLVRKGDYNFNSPDHHGTPRQRGAAFVAGYKAGGTADAAYRRGLNYISALRDAR
jgi:hypothetical protein